MKVPNDILKKIEHMMSSKKGIKIKEVSRGKKLAMPGK